MHRITIRNTLSKIIKLTKKYCLKMSYLYVRKMKMQNIKTMSIGVQTATNVNMYPTCNNYSLVIAPNTTSISDCLLGGVGHIYGAVSWPHFGRFNKNWQNWMRVWPADLSISNVKTSLLWVALLAIPLLTKNTNSLSAQGVKFS